MELKDIEGSDLTILVLGMPSWFRFFSAISRLMMLKEFPLVKMEAALLIEEGERRKDVLVPLGGVL